MRSDMNLRSRGQSGFTLIELVVVIAITSVVLTAFASWSVISLRQQADSLDVNATTFGIGLANVYFPRDVAATKIAVSQTDESGALRSDGDIFDCDNLVGVGGEGYGGKVLAAMISGANRRIVYTLVDGNSPEEGSELWRRECPNLSESSDATLAEPGDLNADPTTNPGYIDASTPSNNGSAIRLAERISSVSSTCPSTTGVGQNANCTSLRLSVDFRGRQRPVVVQGTRKINSYAPPGTLPVADFVIREYPVEIGRTVTLDASRSFDPRGGDLTYEWVISGSPLPSSSSPLFPHTFTALGSTTVTLVVRNTEGTASEPREEPVTVVTARPQVVVQGTPLTGVRNSPRAVLASVTASSTTLGDITWDWGDGTPLQTISTCAGLVTCTVSPSHTYPSAGLRVIRVSAIDAVGQRGNAAAVMSVLGQTVYVSQLNGNDTNLCTLAAPCATIVRGVARASETGRTAVLVTSGTAPYGRFNTANGVSVSGAWSDDFSTTTGTRSRVVAALSSGAWSALYATGTQDVTLSNLQFEGAATVLTDSGVVAIDNGSNISFENVLVSGGTGANATGVLVTGGSTALLTASTVTSGTATGAGSSAYGARVLGGSTLIANNSTVLAAAGVAGSNFAGLAPAQGAAGCVGNAGSAAVSAGSPGLGGGQCADGGVRKPGFGGAGAKWGAPKADGAEGSDGLGGAWGGRLGRVYSGDPAGPGGGAGGVVAVGGGGGGSGGESVLAISNPLFVVNTGSLGSSGNPGGGGGGGGGGYARNSSGGGGGGGGGGGSSGTQGLNGGGGGGASFGIYAINSSVSLDGTTVQAGTGGAGGQGSSGGPGGTGGTGGNPGGGNNSGCFFGGAGGGGAGGGGGGGAGGGAGGQSISVFNRGSGTYTSVNVTLIRASFAAIGGGGGAGGSGGVGGQPGFDDPNCNGSSTYSYARCSVDEGSPWTSTGKPGCAKVGQSGGAPLSNSPTPVPPNPTWSSDGIAGSGGSLGRTLRVWDNGTTQP